MSVTTDTMIWTATRRMRRELRVFIACVALSSSSKDFAFGDLELLDNEIVVPCDATNVLRIMVADHCDCVRHFFLFCVHMPEGESVCIMICLWPF